jgi:plasmid stabilization system protein ParE
MRTVFVLSAAEHDIELAADWYEVQQAGVGNEFLADFGRLKEFLAARPFSFPLFLRNVRRARFRRFPYSAYFVVEREAISVVAVVHASRKQRAQLKSRI